MNKHQNHHITDAELETSGQMFAQSLVKNLGDETPDLVWRSELNLKLMEVSQQKTRQKLTLRWLGFGSSLAGVAASVAIFTALSNPTAPSQSTMPLLTSDLTQVHQENLAVASVSGTGTAVIPTSDHHLMSEEFELL